MTSEPEDDGLFHCWCGAVGPFDEMCDMTCLDRSCGGTGSLNCECGGDFCVCHNHGEVECPGCEDCDPDDDYDGEEWWEAECGEDFSEDNTICGNLPSDDDDFGEGIFDEEIE